MDKHYKFKKVKRKMSQKGDDTMATVLYLEKSKEKTKSCTIPDMIFDAKKRKETYEFYDNKYEETKDEKDLLEMMTKHRKGEK